MINRVRVTTLCLVLVASLAVVASAYAASYWFYQGSLSGVVWNPRDPSGDGWSYQTLRMSFDNTPKHTQNSVAIYASNGNWEHWPKSCSTGSGCDATMYISWSTFVKGGCQVPTALGYSVWTNCSFLYGGQY
jgi:hypothetical protein